MSNNPLRFFGSKYLEFMWGIFAVVKGLRIASSQKRVRHAAAFFHRAYDMILLTYNACYYTSTSREASLSNPEAA